MIDPKAWIHNKVKSKVKNYLSMKYNKNIQN